MLVTWISAIANALSCLVVAFGVGIALGELRTASRQREDAGKAERTKITLDYLDHFRHARYLICWDVDENGKPAFVEYSTYWCMDTLVRLKTKHGALTSVEVQCVDICTNFVISIATLLSHNLVNEVLLIETFADQIIMVDDVLALPVHADNGFMRNLRHDEDYIALVQLSRAQLARRQSAGRS